MAFIVGGLLIGAGTAVAGAVISSKGASKAADTAAAGSERELEFNREALEFSRESRDIARGDQAPYREAGVTALNALMSMTGLGVETGATESSGGWTGDLAGSGTAVDPYRVGLDTDRNRWNPSTNRPVSYLQGEGGIPTYLDGSPIPNSNPWSVQPRYGGGVMGYAGGGYMDYNINELGPENVYSGGVITRNPNPATIDGKTGYVEPNIESRQFGGFMGAYDDTRPYEPISNTTKYPGGIAPESPPQVQPGPVKTPPGETMMVPPQAPPSTGNSYGNTPEEFGAWARSQNPETLNRITSTLEGRVQQATEDAGGTEAFNIQQSNPETRQPIRAVPLEDVSGAYGGVPYRQAIEEAGGRENLQFLPASQQNPSGAGGPLASNGSAVNPGTGGVRENPGGVEGGYNFMTDPGYNFRFDEGMRGLERSAAARGGLLSGGFGRKAIRYGQDYASNEYTNVYNRISNIAGLGQVSATNSGNAALTAGQGMGIAAQGSGTAAAQGAVASAYGQQGSTNAWANAANQIGQLPWENAFNRGAVYPTQRPG